MTDKVKYAWRWGYDTDAQQFKLLLHDLAPKGRYRLSVSNEQGNALPVVIKSGEREVFVPIPARPNEAISCKIFHKGKQVDSVWVRAPERCMRCQGLEKLVVTAIVMIATLGIGMIGIMALACMG